MVEGGKEKRPLWHPRRADLFAAVGLAAFLSQVVLTYTGRPADATVTYAGLALALGLPVFSRVDEARNGKGR